MDTLECIESINNIVSGKNLNVRFVIVDNNSPDKSGIKLQEKFAEDALVDVIISKENLGFAKGNNIGYKFAKDKYNPDFMLVINNDTIVLQSDFFEKIEKIFNETSFDILGPKILTTNEGYNQNPSKILFEYNERGIKTAILDRKISLLWLKFGIYKPMTRVKNIINRIFGKSEIKNEYLKLHGSFLIFSKNYVDNYNGFFSKTYMYMEEDILAYISVHENLQMVYEDSIEIFHKEDAATDTIFNSSKSKLKFHMKNEIKSLEEFLQIVIDSSYYENDVKS